MSLVLSNYWSPELIISYIMAQEENFRITYLGNKPRFVNFLNDFGQLHRDNGCPASIFSDGSKFWYINGLRHRDNGPAVESSNGDKFWYKNGSLHRTDGPALEYATGNKFWYIDGLPVPKF